MPTQIRELLESPTKLTDPLPPGAEKLATELETETSNMLSSAERQDPFKNPSLPDTENAETRYKPQPTALLVLLTAHPRTRGHETLVTPLEGAPQTLITGRFHYDLAKLLHENAVRIPAYLVRSAFAQQDGWLGTHISDAILAVRSETTTLLEVIGGENLGYHLHYRPDLGIWYEKITRRTPPTDHPDDHDSWF